MATIDSALSTLVSIQTKVRRLTRSPSESQLTTADLNNYINTFVVYDFPEHLRTFNLRKPFSFWCNPYQDEYSTDVASFGGASQAEQNILYNFQNNVLTVHPPVYIAGYQGFYSQSREQFYGIYPNTNSIQSIGTTGDGVTTSFTGVVNSAYPGVFPNPGVNNQQGGSVLVKRNVLFESVDVNGNGISLVDVPIIDSTTGNPTVWGNLYVPGSTAYQAALVTPPMAAAPYTPVIGGTPNANNYINYATGAFTITFPYAPASGMAINSQTIPQIVALPQAMLWYGNKFVLRPVPDQPYQVNFEVFLRPTALLNSSDQPLLAEYWQYIAYGAAKKIFEDRMDLDSVQLIMPEFKKQEALCGRRNIVQWTNERAATIYTEQVAYTGQGGWGWGSGGPF